MRSWSLAGRLAGLVAIVLLVVWIAASLFSMLTLREEILEISDDALELTADRLVAVAPLLDGPAASADVGGDRADYASYQIRDADGRVLAKSQGAPAVPLPAPLRPGFFEDDDYRVFTAANADRSLFVQVAETQAERREAVRDTVLSLVAPLAVALVAAALGVRLILPQMMRSIRRAQAEISSRGAGNLEPIPPLGLPREVAPVVGDVNRLLARLKAALDAERAFAANSAHELRTPVAAALAQSQILAAETEGVAHVRAETLVGGLRRLGHTVEKLLQLSRTEAGVGLSRAPVDLNLLAETVVGDYSRHSRFRDRITLRRCTTPAVVLADTDALGIALANLIDNAFTHAGPGAHVTVAVEPRAILVEDDGCGVEPERLSTLAEPFVRGTSQAPGSGLGLAIASTIARQSGGVLRLESGGPGTGLRAAIVLSAEAPDGPSASANLAEPAPPAEVSRAAPALLGGHPATGLLPSDN